MFNVFWDWSVTVRGGVVLWALTNVIIAQAASPDDLLSWGLTLAGVTVPFGVGWAWNRQWADAVRRQNEFLKEQDLQLRKELVDERTEKLTVYEERDKLLKTVAQFEAEAILARANRERLEQDMAAQQQRMIEQQERLARLEQVVQLRRQEVQAAGADRRQHHQPLHHREDRRRETD